MSSGGGAGDTPAVLQLQKWDSKLQSQLQLSKFRLVTISPSRDLLLLLSYQCEALLVPLVFGKFYSEDSHKSKSPRQETGPGSLEIGQHQENDENIKDAVFSHRGSFCTSEYCPIISNVKSLAWGHCGDAYSRSEESDFREILVVSSDTGIVAHAFRQSCRNELFESVPEGEAHTHGKWVEWGPNHRTEVVDVKNTHSGEDLGETSGTENVKYAFEDVDSSSGSKLHNWFQSFLVELDAIVSSGKYLAKFPAKSLFPQSAAVVSFDIYDNTLKFLDFTTATSTSTAPLSDMESLSNETVVGQVRTTICSEDSRDLLYTCSKVFNSYSHRLIGMVLNFPPAANTEAYKRNEGKVLVVVMMLNQWGFQWVCSVDLQDQYAGSGPSTEWADFQFSEGFLVCLATSGLISIWGAETGNFVSRLDVLKSCSLHLNVCPGPVQSELSVNGESASATVKIGHEVDQNNDMGGREASNSKIVCSRTFRRLMVVSHSLILAVVDELGVVYVIWAAECVSKKNDISQRYLHPYKYSDIGILSSWKVAGSEIGSPKMTSDISPFQNSYVSKLPGESFKSENYTGETKIRNREHFYDKEMNLHNYRSGFSNCSQTSSWKLSNFESEMSSRPLSRIFLPLEKYNSDISICFSPFGITRLVKSCSLGQQKMYKIVQTSLDVVSTVADDGDLGKCCMPKRCPTQEFTCSGELIGCFFQGCLYLVTHDGLSVILPAISVSSSILPVETIRYWQPNTIAISKSQINILLETDDFKELGRRWQIEVLDRTLLYEGPEEAEQICLDNGWDLKIVRLRRMQIALHYLHSEEIEKSLDMLVDANLAEEGILHLLFTCVYHIFCKTGSDSEVALASRLLTLAASFATKMVRRYGLAKHKQKKVLAHAKKDLQISYVKPLPSMHKVDEISYSRRLYEMARFLEVIRNLQSHLTSKRNRLGQVMTDATIVVDANSVTDGSPLPTVSMDSRSHGLVDPSEAKTELCLTSSDLAVDHTDKFALPPIESAVGKANPNEHYVHETGVSQRKKHISLENSKSMITRWGVDSIDLKTIVKDALESGRLPLAVLQLHLMKQKELDYAKDPHDTFSEISEIGRAIAYDLFLKGESGLAVETLLRLGEDVKIILRQLLFGTVRRKLRRQIAEEMRSRGHLTPHEWKTLERMFLIERLYPSFSFSAAFVGKKKVIFGGASASTLSDVNHVKLKFKVSDDLSIECGDIDGAVTGSWAAMCDGSPEVCEDKPHGAYWVSAAIWSDAWDQRTVDRIMLDQPLVKGVNVAWESQLEYSMSHSNCEEISKLLDVIPISRLSEGTLEICSNTSHISPYMRTDSSFLDHAMYICAPDELETVCMDIPHVKIFRSSAINTCSAWLKMLLEEELAKKYIFLKEYWENISEFIALLARAGLIIDKSKITIIPKSSTSVLDLAVLNTGSEPHKDAEEALHKLVVHYCTQHNLPNLLDLYLDHSNLVLDDDSLSPFLEAAGDCQWAKWLLFSRIKGHEYEASLSNARSNMSRQMIRGSNLSVLNIDEIIRTVDDMAEGGGEMAALATLMYAAAPMQKCLSAGSVNRQCSFSSQCTLENLRPGLQQFPTLWRTLVTACLGQDDNTFCSKSNTTNVFGKSVLTDYLTWRDTVFSSSGGDTYLMQMLPCWFPKSIKKLVSLFVQGPLGWQSLPTRDYRETYVITATGKAGISPTNWEVAIQRNVEELYSSLEEKGFGVEHHLHRGRALAAFKHILSLRASKLKSAHDQKETFGQTNIQSDIQAILAPLTESEKSLLSSVVPLAIMHFEDSVLVASCSFLLELCGLPVSTLRVDLAVLQRISSYYNSIKNTAQYGHVSPKGSAIHAVSSEGDISLSLAQSLADNYIHHGFNNLKRNGSRKVSKGKKPSLSLMTVLQHLEKASLPLVEEGKTCGYWLSSGNGDGYDFRSQQKDASMQWNLVTSFCQMHQLPLSTKYLALLAKDNDWVGFLTEAQMGGFPSDVIVEVAAKEFTDPRLKTHVLTVLKSIHSSRKKTSPSTTNELTSGRNEMSSVSDTNTIVPVELFGLLAECERQKNPGEALLTKSKDLLWPLLAIIASCFSDVSPLSCLMVWLEITAARETSSIKVNDISSKIANSVGAAVEVTNALPCGSRSLMFHYNRRNPKRRRLVEPALGDFIVDGCIKVPSMSSSTVESIAQEITSDGRNKITTEKSKGSIVSDEGLASLSNMIAVLCEQHLFLPLLRAFEMFLPSCSLLPFIRSLQAFSQLRLSEASAHLTSFSIRIKEEPFLSHTNVPRDGQVKTSWISSTAVKSAESMLSTCPSAYEKRCLLQLLTAVDFGDGGSASSYFRRLYWKISLAEPPLRKDEDAYLGNEILDDTSLLNALVANGRWEQARNWARQLESSGPSWKAAVHQVTEAQAEAMVVEWKEYLWDVPEERSALWGHCQTLFLRYSFPPLQAGLFFLKHAEDNEKDIPARDLHEMLLLALQWLSGTITQSPPVYHLHLLREIETRVWLLAVESETQAKAEGDFVLPNSVHNIPGNSTSIIEQTANIIAKMDSHINSVRLKPHDRSSTRENNLLHTRFSQFGDSPSSVMAASSSRAKRRSKTYLQIRRPTDNVDINNDSDDNLNSPFNVKSSSEVSRNLQIWEDNMKIEASVSGWEEKVRPAEVERAILSLLEFGQITAAKQLQVKLSPAYVLPELVLVDAALKVAAFSSASPNGEISESQLDAEILSAIQALSISSNSHIDLLQVLESLAAKCGQGSGQGLCWRIIAVVKAAKVLGLTFSEAFEKRPIELLQLLSLKAQDSLEEAKLLVQTHVMSPPRIARILAESFLKGLLAAHRGGYMDSQKEEGPAPLLWRFSDFLKWAKLCPSEPEIGHALMRLVMTGQEIPHACEVELLILSHHFYLSSACLDGVDVLVTLAANRVESYVSEGGFSCLARLITGVSNFHALNFILNILIENGQLDLLLKKYSTAETGTATAEAVRGFRMSVLTSLKLFNPHDLDAFAMVYEHFDMKHETAALLQSRSTQYVQQWLSSRYRDRMTEDLLDAMRYTIDSAQVYSTIDAGHKTYRACARASLLSLQIRIPDLNWLELSATNARRMFVDQSRFQEALIVAEAYNLNQPSEWAPILWNLMLKPDVIEEFISEFVAVLPLQPSMLLELARFYRAEVAARGDQSHFSVWLSPGGLPAEWVKHLGRSFRSLLKRTRDLRVRIQLATIATGFGDVIDSCSKVLDKVPDSTVPLILRRGHGGAYLPLM